MTFIERTRRMRIALTLVVLAALGSTARAADSVGVVIDNGTPPRVLGAITAWLSRHGHTFDPDSLPGDAISALVDSLALDNTSGARGVVEKYARPSSIVFARAKTVTSETTSDRQITVTVFWLVKGRDAIRRTKTCERCTDESLSTTTDALMNELMGGAASGHVKLKSTPPGARITIDGKPVGVTPLDWDLPTGKHTVRMDLDGFRSASRDVIIGSDQSDLVVLSLEATGPTDGGGPSRWVPWTLVGLGVAAAGTGGILLALDEDPTGKHPTYRDTGPLGVSLLIGGGAIAASGAVWLFVTRSNRSTPVAMLTSDIAYVGWLGRF